MANEVEQLMERLAAQEQRIAQLEAQLVAASLAIAVARPPDGAAVPVADEPRRPTRRDLVRLAGAAGAAAVGVAAVGGSRRALADYDGTTSGAGSSTKVGVYASPTGVLRPALGADVEMGVAGIGEAGVFVSNWFVPIGAYGATRTGWGVVGEVPSDAYGGVFGKGVGNSYGVRGDSETSSGVYALSTSGMGVEAASESGLGVSGSTQTGNAGVAGFNTGTKDGVYGSAVSGMGVRGASATGIGVWGESSGNAPGVSGRSNGGFGVAARGGTAAIVLIPVQGAPSARTVPAGTGAIDIDTNGDVWLCTAAGTPGTWRKLSGPATAGAYHPVTPGRVYDSRVANPSGLVGILASGAKRTISLADRRDFTTGASELTNFVPAGATAVTANVTVVDTVGAGFVTLNPGGTTTATTAGINWSASGQILNNGQNLTLDAARQVTLVCGGGGSTHVVIDVTGYYL